MAYDINDNIACGKLDPLFLGIVYDEVADMFENGHDFLDTTSLRVYIADMDGNENVQGVMVADLDLDRIECDESPVEWALGNVPAPGTGAAGRMELITVGEAAGEIASRASEFVVVREH